MDFLNFLADSGSPAATGGQVAGGILGNALGTPPAKPGNAISYGAPVNVTVTPKQANDKQKLMETGLYVFGALMIARAMFPKKRPRHATT